MISKGLDEPLLEEGVFIKTNQIWHRTDDADTRQESTKLAKSSRVIAFAFNPSVIRYTTLEPFKMNLQKAMIRLRAMIQLELPHRSRNHIVQRLPREIFDIIFALLSIPDRICFSLSCKRIFASFRSSLDTQKTQLSQLLPAEHRSILWPNAKQRPRNRLLLQLENKRWVFCNDCWILHPRSKWWSAVASGSYCPGCHLLREQKCSTLSSGEVDMCPCLSITFRDKQHLMETCKFARAIAHPGHEYYYNKSLYHPSFTRLTRFLYHDCTFQSHSFTKVQIRTRVWIEEGTVSLHVFNRYKFELNGPSSEGVPTCVHTDPRYWLQRLYKEAGSNFKGWHKNRCYCSWTFSWGDWNRSMTERGSYSFEITVHRDLGDAKWPNKIWNRHLRP